MNEKEQMSIKTDKKIEVFTSYLPIFKNAFKKISKILLFIFIFMFINIGNNTSVMSETSKKHAILEINEIEIRVEYEKYVKMYKEIYQQSVIQQIEFESEIVIPDYIDFKYVEYTYNLANQLNLSPRTAFRLMFKESSFIDNAVSSKGAQGFWQLMPSTRKTYYESLCVDTLNLDKNEENIYIGMHYLIDLHTFWRERGNSESFSWKLSLASYNAGTANVIKYQGVPPYKETKDFVYFILKPHSNPTFYANIIKKNTKKNIS